MNLYEANQAMFKAHADESKKQVDAAHDELIKTATDVITIVTERLIDKEKNHQGKFDVGSQIRVAAMKLLATAIKREIKRL